VASGLAGQGRDGLGHIVQAVEPTSGLVGRVVGLLRGVCVAGWCLVTLPRVVLGRVLAEQRFIEPAAQHPQGQACATHRERQVQVQAQGLRRGLVAPDDAQPFAVRTRREVQICPVLDA